MKLACESLISKRGSIFEILLKIWSEYVLAGRLICNWKTKSDKTLLSLLLLTFGASLYEIRVKDFKKLGRKRCYILEV